MTMQEKPEAKPKVLKKALKKELHASTLVAITTPYIVV